MAESTQARDPVCGMYVDMATATFRSKFDGETYYFCSAGCKQMFDANPAHFAERSVPLHGAQGAADMSPAGEPLERHEPRFTKSDGVVSPKFGSAGSGGAEYERLPESHDDVEKREEGGGKRG